MNALDKLAAIQIEQDNRIQKRTGGFVRHIRRRIWTQRLH